MLGGGKYEAACTVARETTRARGTLLIVIGGEHGDGFSAQCDLATLIVLPELLERIAADIRADRGVLAGPGNGGDPPRH